MAYVKKCAGKKHDGKRCTRTAGDDSTLCWQHAKLAQPGHTLKKAPKTVEAQARFLQGYGAIGTVTAAAEHAGVSRRQHYRWVKGDADYATDFGHAREEAADRLEQEARRRAVAGVEEPVYYQGEVVGHVRKHSDTLLIFLLKGAKPNVYRERHQHQHDGIPAAVAPQVIFVLPSNGREGPITQFAS